MIFISHSSHNKDEAIVVRDWLIEQGWGKSQIFIDIDDLFTGDRWRQSLNSFSTGCEAVIACLSDDWLRSVECIREFNFAEIEGKPIFPLVVAPITEPIPRFITDVQITELTANKRTEGFAKLQAALLRARIAPQYFPWPPPNQPNRSPYRGPNTLEPEDAAIFFGRDSAILRCLDMLRRMRTGGVENLMVILGASGAGKSSFLRAGLLSRLKRDEDNFLVLPAMRPGRTPMSGSTGLITSLGTRGKLNIDALTERFSDLRAPVLARLNMQGTLPDEGTRKLPTIIIPIDQGEELFTYSSEECTEAITALATILAADLNIIAIMTIRSDSFSRLQNDPHLSQVGRVPFDLSRLSPSAFKDVIEGPGQLSIPKIRFEPELVERLLADLTTADALPLLAFTLERLTANYGKEGLIRLCDYEGGLGGLGGAIEIAVRNAFQAASTNLVLPAEPEAVAALARRAFIPFLVTIDDIAAAPKRRMAAMSEIPEKSRPLIQHLVDQRLLATDMDENGVVVEVSHEAVLRNWHELARWIEEEREYLLWRSRLKFLIEEWKRAGRDVGAALQGIAQEEALNWLKKKTDELSREEQEFIRWTESAAFQIQKVIAESRELLASNADRISPQSLTTWLKCLIIAGEVGEAEKLVRNTKNEKLLSQAWIDAAFVFEGTGQISKAFEIARRLHGLERVGVVTRLCQLMASVGDRDRAIEAAQLIEDERLAVRCLARAACFLSSAAKRQALCQMLSYFCSSIELAASYFSGNATFSASDIVAYTRNVQSDVLRVALLADIMDAHAADNLADDVVYIASALQSSVVEDGDIWWRALLGLRIVDSLALVGRFDEAEQEATQLKPPWQQRHASMLLAYHQARCGKFEQAHRLAARAMDGIAGDENIASVIEIGTLVAGLLGSSGSLALGRELANLILGVIGEVKDPTAKFTYTCRLAQAYGSCGDLDQAITLVNGITARASRLEALKALAIAVVKKEDTTRLAEIIAQARSPEEHVGLLLSVVRSLRSESGSDYSDIASEIIAAISKVENRRKSYARCVADGAETLIFCDKAEKLQEAAREIQGAVDKVMAWTEISEQLATARQGDAATKIAEEALQLVESIDESDNRAKAYARISKVYALCGRMQEGRSIARRCHLPNERLEAFSEILWACINVGESGLSATLRVKPAQQHRIRTRLSLLRTPAKVLEISPKERRQIVPNIKPGSPEN